MSPLADSTVVPEIFGTTIGCVSLAVVLAVSISMCLWLHRSKKNGDPAELSKTSPPNEQPLGTESKAPRSSHRKLPEIPNHSTSVLNNAFPAENGSIRSSHTNSDLYAQVDLSVQDEDASCGCKQNLSTGNTLLKKKQSTERSSGSCDENVYARVRRSDTYESETAEVDENETDTDIYAVVDAPKPPSNLVGVASHQQQGCQLDKPNVDGAQGLTEEVDLSRTARVAAEDDVEGPRPRQISAEPQVHFSGDSQISQDSKGYISISVREPIANLKVGMLKTETKSKERTVKISEPVDCFYATVSDAEDSEDEDYAAIVDVSAPVDTDVEQDTYAVIGDSSSPPSPVHSREACRLDEASTSADGASRCSGHDSPKPEKRQANSPLPPPPILTAQRMTLDSSVVYSRPKRGKAYCSTQHSPEDKDLSRGSQSNQVEEAREAKDSASPDAMRDQLEDNSALYAQVVKPQRNTVHFC